MKNNFLKIVDFNKRAGETSIMTSDQGYIYKTRINVGMSIVFDNACVGRNAWFDVKGVSSVRCFKKMK